MKNHTPMKGLKPRGKAAKQARKRAIKLTQRKVTIEQMKDHLEYTIAFPNGGKVTLTGEQWKEIKERGKRAKESRQPEQVKDL